MSTMTEPIMPPMLADIGRYLQRLTSTVDFAEAPDHTAHWVNSVGHKISVTVTEAEGAPAEGMPPWFEVMLSTHRLTELRYVVSIWGWWRGDDDFSIDQVIVYTPIGQFQVTLPFERAEAALNLLRNLCDERCEGLSERLVVDDQ
jgi:hypothetical protein